MSTENNAINNEQEIIAGILRVEAFNDQFRQPNPKGRYPICRPVVGTSTCDRCGQDITGPTNRGPCPAVPAGKRWGETWEAMNSFPDKPQLYTPPPPTRCTECQGEIGPPENHCHAVLLSTQEWHIFCKRQAAALGVEAEKNKKGSP